MTIVEKQSTSTLVRRRWTREEYYRMAEAGVIAPGERVELIEGDVIVMSPQNFPHANGTQMSADVVREVFGPAYHVRVQLPMALAGGSMPEPDVAVIAGQAADLIDHPTTAALILEVADSSLATDRLDKASLYARARIPEYWILNLVNGRLEVYREPVDLPSAPLGHGYRSLVIVLPGDTVRPLARPEVEIPVDALLPRVG
jgi:Uma2 family endonuclease